MKKIRKTKLVGVFMILALLLTVPAYRTNAEEKINQEAEVENDMEATIEVESRENVDILEEGQVMELDEDYNTPRSNRLQIEADKEASGGDYNSSRSNKPSTEISLDPDDDGDGIDDLREGDTAIEGEDYNTPRSNRSENNIDDLDIDSDGDGIDIIDEDEVTIPKQDYNPIRLKNKRGEAVIIDRGRENATDLADVDAVCGQSKGAALDEEGKVYCWGSGFSVKAESNSGGGAGKVSLADIDFESVRDWSDEEKGSLKEFGRNVAEERREGKMARMIIRNMDDERIRSIEMDETGGRVRYKARMRLLGFIPLEREVEARIGNGVEKVDYPWYGFLSRKPDGSKISSLLSDLGDLI